MTSSAVVQSPAPGVIPAPPPRRRSLLRNFATFLILVLLLVVITGYVYATDSTRVRIYTQRYLSQLTGAHVAIGHATLSIFEGLRLDDVKITADGNELFSAKTVQLDYDPHALLHGKVDAGRVLAVEPHVRLIENVDTREWNFEPLYRRQSAKPAKPGSPNKPINLPQILVRNALVDYAQIVNGRSTDVGTLHLEGQFVPDDNKDNYRFTLQSRVGIKGTFPIVDGWLRTDGSRMSLELRDVEFVDEIKTILPARVRQYWEEHALAGRLNRTRLEYARLPDGKTAFTVVTDLAGVQLTIPPANWMADSDRARIKRWQNNFGEVAGPAMGGSAMAADLLDSIIPQPLHLDDVDATFVFTDDRVRIRNLVGRLDANRVRITGDVDGYTANSGFALRVESLPDESLALAKAPAFIPSMPWPIQELYYRFEPVGAGTFFLNVARPADAAKVTLNGELNFKNSAFSFDRFPYPADRASGTLRFENDPKTGDPMLNIVSVKCRGYEAGPNKNANVEITGKVTPLDMTAGADIRIAGSGLTSDEKLIEAMPPPTRKAVRNFDSSHTGKLPSFDGDFDCHVHRDIGQGKPWMVTTHLDIRDGRGSFIGFPYLVKDVAGGITIFDDHLELQDIKLPCDGGLAQLTGDINWRKHDPATGLPLVQTDLTLKARQVTFNDRLLNALPPAKANWLRKIGLQGKVDIDGKIIPTAPDSDDPAVNLTVAITEASANLANGAVRVTGLSANALIDPSQAIVTNLKGAYGKAQIDCKGTVIWTGDEPQVSASAHVADLALDDNFMRALPADSGAAIRALHANGSVDADLRYDASTQNAYRVDLRPRQLSIKPDFLPLAFTNIAGSIEMEPGRVALNDITAKCEGATVSTQGVINTTTGDATMAISGRDIVVTDKVTQAMPDALRNVVQTSALKGHLAFDCPKIVAHGIAATHAPAATDGDIDFDTKLWFQPVDLSLGVAFNDVHGTMSIAGKVHGGNLQGLDGQMNLDSLKIADRSVGDVYAELHKAPDKDVLQIGKIDAKLAGGNVAGQIDTSITKSDPRYALNLQLRGAKIAEITGENDNHIDGTITASLAMEGKWSENAGRRGRGDVVVDGRNMYRVPVVFGLLQVANLAMPNDTPIQQASLRYTIEGPRLILDQIDLRATENVMQGSGEMNFDTKKVDLHLSLANSAADALPIFGELIKAARQGMLQIRVSGTLQAPQVQASAFNIFSTTVDEVKAEK